MPYLLLGPDDFSKKIFVDSLAKKLGADLVVFREGDVLPDSAGLSQTDLFSKAKVFYFQDLVPEFLATCEDRSC